MPMIHSSFCDCTDWTIHVSPQGKLLRFKPSMRTFYSRLTATLLAAIFMAMVAWIYGFPPGSNQKARIERRIGKLEQVIKQLDREARQAAVSAASPMGKTIQQQRERDLNQARNELANRQQDLATFQPTLGPWGDAAYWTFMGLMLTLGIGVPAWSVMERIDIDANTPGVITVRRRGQIVRSQRYDTAQFKSLAVIVQQIVTTDHETYKTSVHGWRWRVRLSSDPDDPNASALEVWPEMEDSLPAQVARMTDRARLVVGFFEEVTGMECAEPIIASVSSVDRRPLGMSKRYRVWRSSQ